MSLLTRFTTAVFGATTGTQTGIFGSLANGTPETTNNPASVQALTGAWAEGWPGAVVDEENPALEDMEGFCFQTSYLMNYVMQQGLPEWDTGTQYNSNSLVMFGNTIYQSLQTPNQGNTPTTSSTYWTPAILSNTVLSSSTGAYQTTGQSALVAVTGASCSIVTVGAPVMITLVPDNGNATEAACVGIANSGTSATTLGATFALYRDGTAIGWSEIEAVSLVAGQVDSIQYAPGMISFYDPSPSAGSHVYALYSHAFSNNSYQASTTIQVLYCKLKAKEERA